MTAGTPADLTGLLDWRRRVQDLYAEVRDLHRVEPRAAWRRWREGRDALFARHPQSPLPPGARAGFRGLPVWDYDPALNLRAALEPVPHETFGVGTSGAGAMTFTRFARLSTPLGTLDAYWLEDYAGGLFVPLRDGTAGAETYGGGRYLLDTAKGADLGGEGGQLVLDFNFAYHPSCRFDPRWTCPLAPPGNRLSAPVRAGERL